MRATAAVRQRTDTHNYPLPAQSTLRMAGIATVLSQTSRLSNLSLAVLQLKGPGPVFTRNKACTSDLRAMLSKRASSTKSTAAKSTPSKPARPATTAKAAASAGKGKAAAAKPKPKPVTKLAPEYPSSSPRRSSRQ